MLAFDYTKADGTTTERVVIPLNKPSDLLKAIDVSEFDESERQYYSEQVLLAQENFKEHMREVGLGSQYRSFKASGITYAEV